jgi:ribosomal-protein-alanine N-acetyltransferase
MATRLFELDQSYFPTPWKLEAWTDLQMSDHHLVILYSENVIIGFCLFATVSADSFAHLLKILVLPESQKLGLGEKLLQQALNDCGCSQFFLEVVESNIAALRLYQSQGFKVIHRKKDFYGTGRSALIMTKS